MRTQEEIDAEYLAQRRARREAMAEKIKTDNAKLVAPKDYRGIQFYMNQSGNYTIPDAPKELEGLFTSPSVLMKLIDSYLDRKEKNNVSE